MKPAKKPTMKFEVTLKRVTTDYAVVEVDATDRADAIDKARRVVDREPKRFRDGDVRVEVAGTLSK